MYVSRLSFYSLPAKTQDVEQELKKLLDMVIKAAGTKARVLRTHFASLGAPDVVFEQEAASSLNGGGFHHSIVEEDTSRNTSLLHQFTGTTCGRW